MAIDIRNLSPTELVRLLNSTPLGTVINAPKLNRQMNEAGLRISPTRSDGKRINLLKYVAWLARHRDRPQRPTVSYEQRRQREAERNQAKNRAGRDIGPPPEVVDPERRAACERDFRGFCELYFPAAFCLPWSDDHLRIMAKIERAVLEGGLFAFAMPRGSGKTTLARAAGLWAVLYGHRAYVCLIGSAEDQAKAMLDAIKREMLANALLLADFPEAIYPVVKLENNARRQVGQLCDGEPTYVTWASDKLVMPTIAGSPSSGSTITVAGLDSNIRGQQHTKMDGTIVRPSLVILDDPQTRQSAASLTQTKHRLSILNGDVLGLGGPGVKMAGFMTCTKIYHDDLAEQILDRERNPDWQGECTKMVYSFPTDEKKWDRYAQIRADSLRADGDGSEATAYYRRNREAMDKGAIVAWPARHNADELSAIQHAINLKLRDEEAFFAEYQNEPMSDAFEDDDLLTADQIAERLSKLERGRAPLSAEFITAFIDVQDRLLYWLVAAWASDFTGEIIDYGTWPPQRQTWFSYREAKRTLGRARPGVGKEAQILYGLEQLTGELMEREFQREDGAVLSVGRLLIDAGHETDVVRQFCRRSEHRSRLIPAFGQFVGASHIPYSERRRQRGERIGHHWRIPPAEGKGIRHVLSDVNYWKSFVRARLATAPGDRASLTLYGRKANAHRLMASHLTAEHRVRTEGRGRTVDEWKLPPSQPDNHWLDCLVGSAVAASMEGAALEEAGEAKRAPRRPRKRKRLSELQRAKG